MFYRSTAPTEQRIFGKIVFFRFLRIKCHAFCSGKLVEAEDNMNCQMSDITVTYRDGRTQQLQNVFIRGSKVRFMILPDMLKNAPMLKRVATGRGSSRGKPPMRGARWFLFYIVGLVFHSSRRLGGYDK